jgi:hypothetical protein
MAIESKDFKVKNGLQVANGGTFGGTVVVATPTESTHATTKAYVDALASNPIVSVEDSAPAEAVDGQLFISSVTGRLALFLNDAWITLATLADASDIPQHIHDTAIGGTGLVVSSFVDAGYYNDESSTPVDAGFYNTNSWELTYDGGIAIDNFN